MLVKLNLREFLPDKVAVMPPIKMGDGDEAALVTAFKHLRSELTENLGDSLRIPTRIKISADIPHQSLNERRGMWRRGKII